MLPGISFSPSAWNKIQVNFFYCFCILKGKPTTNYYLAPLFLTRGIKISLWEWEQIYKPMRIPIERLPVKVIPDSKRVIARFFFDGDERAKELIKRIMTLSDEEVFMILSPLLQEYSKRHRNITQIVLLH